MRCQRAPGALSCVVSAHRRNSGAQSSADRNSFPKNDLRRKCRKKVRALIWVRCRRCRDEPQAQVGCSEGIATSLSPARSTARNILIIRSAPKIELWGRGDAHKSPLPNGSPWRRLDGCDAGSERRAGVGMLSRRRCHDRGRRLTSVVHDTIFIIQGAALGMPGYRYAFAVEAQDALPS